MANNRRQAILFLCAFDAVYQGLEPESLGADAANKAIQKTASNTEVSSCSMLRVMPITSSTAKGRRPAQA